jgi:hypothetical protein
VGKTMLDLEGQRFLIDYDAAGSRQFGIACAQPPDQPDFSSA